MRQPRMPWHSLFFMREEIMEENSPKPDRYVMQRVEELLREQLEARGLHIADIPPHEIRRKMVCAVHPGGALSYSWEGEAVLEVIPERQPGGKVRWRFFTGDTTTQ